MKGDTIVYRREELYELVWTKPVRHVAKGYGVSDVALAKICRRLVVPVPGRGYWARVAAGAKPKRAPLLPLKVGLPTEITAYHARLPSAARTKPDEDDKEIAPRASEEVDIHVSPSLEAPHELIETASASLRKGKPGEDGIVRCHTRRCLAIEVSPTALERALRIVDAVVRALVTRGLRVEVLEPSEVGVWTPSVTVQRVKMPVTLVHVDDEAVPFAMDEVTEQVEVPRSAATGWRPYERRPTGRLRLRFRDDLDAYRFRAGFQRNWTDTPRRPLERVLAKFVRALPTIAAAIKGERIDDEQRRKEQEEWERQWRREREREALDAERRKRAEQEIANYRLARDIREFAAETRRIIEDGHCDVTPGGELDAWLRWCDDYAERIDPLAALRHEVAKVKAKRAPNAKT